MIIDCDMRKWGGVQHWRFPAELLARDDYGTWLGGRPPTPFIGPRGEGEFDYPFALVIPNDEWWIATFYRQDPNTDIATYVDVATPAEWLADDHVQVVDLDLDVVLRFDGTVYVDDEDEFEEHRVKYGYPADVIDRARRTVAELIDRLEERAEPFGEVGRRWLDVVG